MAGDAEPFSIFSDPSIGETTSVFVVLAFVGSLFMSCARDDDGVAVAVKLHVF